MMLQQLIPSSRGLAAPLNQTGQWVSTPSLGFSGTHVVLLREPGTNNAKVFIFGESGSNQQMRFWRFTPQDTALLTPLSSSPYSSLIEIPHPDSHSADLFCSGHATLSDGRMLLVGGGWLPTVTCADAWILDPSWTGGGSPWTLGPEMALERWYATATPLSDGSILASAGTTCSKMLGFGGTALGTTVAETTARVLRPLELSSRFSWGDTTMAPAQLCTQPSCPSPLVPKDNLTNGQFPPGRDYMAFAGHGDGRTVIYGGRRLSGGSYQLLGDMWLVGNSASPDDSTHGCFLVAQLGDPSITPPDDTIPRPRWGCAATWAGTEINSYATEDSTYAEVGIYIHGGKDAIAGGNVMGDLWRGSVKQSSVGHYVCQWKRILTDAPDRRRFGHTMIYDPGVTDPGRGGLGNAPRGKVLIYGGVSADGTLADTASVFAVGVGTDSWQKGTWRSLQPSGTPPPGRMWQAMTIAARLTDEHDRDNYIFGGEKPDGTLVEADLWTLTRPDTIAGNSSGPGQEESYAWVLATTSGTGPSKRSRASLAYALDGKLLVVFGGDTNGTQQSGGLSNGLFRLQSYGSNNFTWSTPPSRNFSAVPPPTAGMGLVALGDGRVRVARPMERYATAGTSNLAACGQGSVPGTWGMVTTPNPSKLASTVPIADYPNLYQLPDGRLFNAGPAPGLRLADNLYKRFFNLADSTWSDTTGDNQDNAYFGSSAMYRPGKILRAGSVVETGNANTETIDIGSGVRPQWAAYTVNGSHPGLRTTRTHGNLTILPTGDVLASGGVTDDKHIPTSPLNKSPQVWYANLTRWSDWSTDIGHNEWLAPDPQIRNYHSTAILLPDARVLTAGGEDPSPDQLTASVFEPPYLFDGNGNHVSRPDVQKAPTALTYGRSFTIALANPARAATIKSVALMRPGAVTHAFDQGQRYVPLDFRVASNPSRLLVKSPDNAYLAGPGDHMIFVVDSVGPSAPRVPSIAYWTRVRSTPTASDSADTTPPDSAILSLHTTGACDEEGSSPSVHLTWTAPADDDTIAFSGPAMAYDLRYALNASAPSDFRAWTAVATGPPGSPGGTESRDISGLSASVWYRFGVKAMGDNADTSGLSNVLVAKPVQCTGGGGYHDGDGGLVAIASLTAGQSENVATNSQASENTLFPGAPLDSVATDVLQFPGEPRFVEGKRSIYVREGGGSGLSLDRARLLAVDHPFGTEAVTVAAGGIVAGVREPATAVRDSRDHDVTSAAIGSSVEPVYADSGEVLTVSLPAADSSGDYLLIEASDGGGGSGGIRVETASQSPILLATVHPRSRASAQAVQLTGQSTIRLRFALACALRFVGRLGSAQAPVVNSAALLSAVGAGSDWSSEARSLDANDVVIQAQDTLHLTFADAPSAATSRRDWFLALDGTPVSALTATYLSSRVHSEGLTSPPSRFALYQNVPNPFRGATTIAYDLPVACDVRLEIFDLLGRLVRRFESHEAPGRHHLEWDLRDARGNQVAPGVYTYRFTGAAFTARRKMVVLL